MRDTTQSDRHGARILRHSSTIESLGQRTYTINVTTTNESTARGIISNRSIQAGRSWLSRRTRAAAVRLRRRRRRPFPHSHPLISEIVRNLREEENASSAYCYMRHRVSIQLPSSSANKCDIFVNSAHITHNTINRDILRWPSLLS